MLNNFFVAVEAVIPLFCLIGVGLLVKHFKMLNETELAHMNKMVFNIFFGIMMFYNLYSADFSQKFPLDLLIFCIIGVLSTCFIGMAVVCFFEKENKRRGAMVQSLFRSNLVLMGLPIAGNIYGIDNVGVTALTMAAIVPVYNALAVFVLETFRGGKISVVPILKGIAKNSMIAGSIIGLIMQLTGFTLPAFLLKPIAQISGATTPIALVILGASFNIASVKGNKGLIALMTVARLIIIPAIILPIAVFMGFRGVEFVTLITVFCPPCAIAGYAMAQQMNSDAELAGNVVLTTSAFSAFTMFGWIFLSKTLGLF